MRAMYIDESGDLQHALPSSVAVGIPTLGIDGVSRYAVRNMGLIWAIETRNGLAVHLRPSRISPTALASLMFFILDSDPDRVVISHFTDEWRSELVRGAKAAVDRVSNLVQAEDVAQARGIVAQDVALTTGANDRLVSLAREWKPRVTRHELKAFLADACARSDGRYVLFGHDQDRQTFVVDDFGAGIPEWGREYLAASRGRGIESLPDYDFRRFCTSRYSRVVEEFKPRLEKIDARIYWPQFGTRRSTYWRLTLPIAGPDQKMWLLSATAADAGIDLRRAAVHKLGDVVENTLRSHR